MWCKQCNDDCDEDDEVGETQNFLLGFCLLGFIPTSSGSRLELNYGRFYVPWLCRCSSRQSCKRGRLMTSQ